MTDGLVLSAGEGRKLRTPGMTLKVGADRSERWSVFAAEVSPGFDVGAHLHREVEELFYILDGELDLLAFEPRIRTKGDWHSWESKTGGKVVRGGPGSVMFVPAGCPHAFTNPGTTTAWMLFLVTPSGHEHYRGAARRVTRKPRATRQGGHREAPRSSRHRATHTVDSGTRFRSTRPAPGIVLIRTPPCR